MYSELRNIYKYRYVMILIALALVTEPEKDNEMKNKLQFFISKDGIGFWES